MHIELLLYLRLESSFSSSFMNQTPCHVARFVHTCLSACSYGKKSRNAIGIFDDHPVDLFFYDGDGGARCTIRFHSDKLRP